MLQSWGITPDPSTRTSLRPRLSQLAARVSLEPQRGWLGTSEPAPSRLGHCLTALTSRRRRSHPHQPQHGPTERLLRSEISGGELVELKYGFADTFCKGGRNSQRAPRRAPAPSEGQSRALSTALIAECGECKKWGGSGMIKIGVCRHFLQRGETASVRRYGHLRHPKVSHACPARPLVPECVLRESERPNTPTRAERDILSCPKPHSRPQHGPGRRVRRMQKVGEKWYD